MSISITAVGKKNVDLIGGDEYIWEFENTGSSDVSYTWEVAGGETGSITLKAGAATQLFTLTHDNMTLYDGATTIATANYVNSNAPSTYSLTNVSDYFFGHNGADVLNGLAGVDSIYGGLGNDTINGGAGNDFIDGGSGNNSIDGGDGNDTIVVNDDSNTFDFTAGDVTSYGGQDVTGTVNVPAPGEIDLTGNLWKAISGTYEITAESTLTFDYKSTFQPEIAGISFDTNLSWDGQNNQNEIFKAWGTQNNGATYVNLNYSGSGEWETFTVNIGQYFTGSFNYLTIINDHDVSNPMGEFLISQYYDFKLHPKHH